MDSEIILAIALIIKAKYRTGVIPAKPVLIKYLENRNSPITSNIVKNIPNDKWEEVTRLLRKIRSIG